MGDAITMEQVKVPARMSYLKVLRKFVTRVGTKYGFTSAELYAFKSAVDEACTNIIEHGYEYQDGSITLKTFFENNRFTIELIDNGKSFDFQGVTNPDLHNYVSIGKRGGLGIFIIRRLLDEVDYRSTEDGNVLRMTKIRQSQSAGNSVITTPSFFKRLKSVFMPTTRIS